MFEQSPNASFLEELGQTISPIAKKYGIKKVYLFGSRARGDNKENSDYDLLIEFNGKLSTHNFFGFMIEVEQILNERVDLVLNSNLKGRFQEYVLRDRVLIYG